MEKTNRDTLTHTYNCRLCHDTGYVIRSAIIPEYDSRTPVEIGDPCPVCKGTGRLKAEVTIHWAPDNKEQKTNM